VHGILQVAEIGMQAPTSTARPTDNLNIHCMRYSSCVECDHKSRVAKNGNKRLIPAYRSSDITATTSAARALVSPDVTEAEVNRDDQ
jgi:hypothetical protein